MQGYFQSEVGILTSLLYQIVVSVGASGFLLPGPLLLVMLEVGASVKPATYTLK